MKEVLRMMHIRTGTVGQAALNDYNLEVYAGELLYVFGSSGSGLHTLCAVLSGEEVPEEGKIYLEEEELSDRDLKNPEKKGIIVVSKGQHLVDSLTVAENLAVVRKRKHLFRYYSKKNTTKAVQHFLEQEEMELSADSYVYELFYEDRLKLSLLKAKLQRAKLVVLDFTEDFMTGKQGEELLQMIHGLQLSGAACIILAEKITDFSYASDRIQLMKHGKDLMEWRSVPEQEMSDIFYSRSEPVFEGFYDYEWPGSKTLWDYFDKVKEKNPEFWGRYVGLPLLRHGTFLRDKTVYIPRDSALLLTENLSIRQNISLTIPERIGKTIINYISGALEEQVAADFYRLSGADIRKKQVSELSFLERKILSVYRWEISRPDTILLEYPYWGMDLQETEVFREYLFHLKQKGIRVIFFSKSLAELKADCSRIMMTENAEHARLYKEEGDKTSL